MNFYRLRIEENRPGSIAYVLQSRRLFRRWKDIGKFSSEADAVKFAKKDFVYKPVRYKNIKPYP